MFLKLSTLPSPVLEEEGGGGGGNRLPGLVTKQSVEFPQVLASNYKYGMMIYCMTNSQGVYILRSTGELCK